MWPVIRDFARTLQLPHLLSKWGTPLFLSTPPTEPCTKCLASGSLGRIGHYFTLPNLTLDAQGHIGEAVHTVGHRPRRSQGRLGHPGHPAQPQPPGFSQGLRCRAV